MKYTKEFQPAWDEPVDDHSDANELVGFLAGLMLVGLTFLVLWTVFG